MSWSRQTPPVIVAVSVLAAALVVLANAPEPIRVPVVLAFLLACPGLALAPLLGARDLWGTVMLVIALSLAVDLVVATALVYAGASGPGPWFAVLANVSLLGAGAQLWRGRSRA